jgi:hypothetical protein
LLEFLSSAIQELKNQYQDDLEIVGKFKVFGDKDLKKLSSI